MSSGVAVAALAISSPAAAQTVSFNIPSQSLPAAISAFGRQAGLQIVAPAAGFEHVKSRPVVGKMESRDALRKLLGSSGLEVVSDKGGVVVLRAHGSVAPAGSGAARAGEQRAAGEGIVTGRVLDPATGEYLRNAIVSVETADGRRRQTGSAVALPRRQQAMLLRSRTEIFSAYLPPRAYDPTRGKGHLV